MMSFEIEGGSDLQRYMQIPLDEDLNIGWYTRRFKISTNVRDVSIKVSDSPIATLDERFKSLFRGLRDLVKLKTVAFESRVPSMVGSVPIQSLSAAVANSRNLKELFIGNVLLRGSAQDLTAFSATIRRRHSLEEFALVGCRFPEATRAPALDALLRGMADLPNVRAVCIQATDLNQLGTLTSSGVAALCHSKALKEVRLYPFDLTDDQFMTATRSLETNKCLEELSLGVCNFTVVTTAALAKMLRRNSTLARLELTPTSKIEDKFLIQIAEALEENTSLAHLALHGDYGPISQPVKDAFERMLEENYMLRTLKVYTRTETIAEFDMHLRLNRVGRSHLLDPKSRASRLDWVEALHHVKDSLDCIFYCLSVNPFLCHSQNELQGQAMIARRGNKRRRLNDDQDKMTSENSSSVNSSLSASWNSSSPDRSEDRQKSGDSDSRGRKSTSQGNRVTSTSESSNANAKEEGPRRQTSARNQAETGVSASSESNVGSNQTGQHAPVQQQSIMQQPIMQQQLQTFLGALFSGIMGGQQSQSATVSLPTNGAELMAAGLNALVASSQQPQGNQAMTSGSYQYQQPNQTTGGQPPQQQQQQQQQQQFVVNPQVMGQIPPYAQQQVQGHLQQLHALLQQQVQPQQPQQQPQQFFQQPQPTNDTANQTNSMFNLAFPLLLSSMQTQQTQPNSPDQQMQPAFAPNSQVPNQSDSRQIQGHLQGVEQSQVRQNQEFSPEPERVPISEAEDIGSDRNAYPLFLPRDRDCLSSYQCFLRQQIELFEAGQEDVKSTMPGRNKPIRLGQVGIRCRHCAMLPSRYRGTGATYYPAKLDRLYQAAQNMAQTHFNKHCRHIPQEVINELGVLLQGSKSSAGAGKKYWSDGAAMLGVYEDDDILRMDRSRATV